MKKSIFALFIALFLLVGSLVPPALAHGYYRGHASYGRGYGGYNRGYGGYNRGYSRGYNRGWNAYAGQQHWSHQQYAKKGLIGAGTGAVLGGLLANDGYRAGGAVKGGLIGAGAGLGYEYLRRRW
jgi:hypothetical protein